MPVSKSSAKPGLSKPVMTKKRRLQEVVSQFSSVLAAKPLPTEQKTLQELENASLFKVDVEGAEGGGELSKRIKKTEKPKKVSSKKRLHTTTLQKVNQLAENGLEIKGKAEGKVDSDEIVIDYTRPVLRDFWAAGEGGLPPATALAERELRGKNPAEVLNEWNIGSTSRVSAKKTRTMHDRNKKQKTTPVVPLAGVSYNPAAEDHMKALMKLHEVQKIRSKSAEERKAYKVRIERLHAEVKAREAEGQNETENVAESDAESVDLHFPQTAERKTKAQRHREQRHKTLQLEKGKESRAKKLLSDLNKIKAITKEVDQELNQREERAKKRQETLKNKVHEPVVKINGKKIPLETMLGPHPVPEVLAPSQLPDQMRKIPGVGGVIEDQYLKMRLQNVVETGRPKSRGRKDAKLKKIRNVDKFDLEKLSQRVAQPRFKVPQKLLKAAESSSTGKSAK